MKPLVLLAVLATLGADGDTVEPRVMSRERLFREGFDRGWLLPATRSDDGEDLMSWADRLAASPWFGDLASGTRGASAGEVRAAVIDAGRAGLDGFSEFRPHLAALLDSSRLRSSKWDPDEATDGDGFVFFEAWDLAAGTRRWRDLDGSTLVEQGATLMFADLTAIKEAENDYPRYLQNRGASYEWIHPVARSYVVSPADESQPFSALWLRFRCDLPFPFSGYTCELRVLNQLDPAGLLVTDVYSTSEDFLWMAGRDRFYPVYGSDGEWVAMLAVRQLGFDLDSVPDGPEHRRAAIRSGLGNLRLRAERLQVDEEPREPVVSSHIPRFTVRGRD